LCSIEYIQCNPAPRGSPFELILGLCPSILSPSLSEFSVWSGPWCLCLGSSHTLNVVQEIHHRTTKEKSPDKQGPSGDILSAIRKLAKDVEDLKCVAPNPTPSQSPTRPKEVFATGPTFCPSPVARNPKPVQPPSQPNNPWQHHHPAHLVLQIPPTVLDHDWLTGMKVVEAANAALVQHSAKASIIAVKWNDKGNCIAISHPNFNATDLEPLGNIIAAAITGKSDITCTATPDKKWHRVILNRVDMGKSDIDEDIELGHFQGCHSDEILHELQANNPSLATISISEARWLTRPEQLREKSHSSVVLTTSSQEDVELLMCHVWRVVMYSRLASFSRYQDTKPIKQCMNCWAYGHIKCNKDLKCRTCAGNHTEDNHTCLECPPSGDNQKDCNHLPNKCANCAGSHPTDNIKCPTRITHAGTTGTPSKGGCPHHSTPTTNNTHNATHTIPL